MWSDFICDQCHQKRTVLKRHHRHSWCSGHSPSKNPQDQVRKRAAYKPLRAYTTSCNFLSFPQILETAAENEEPQIQKPAPSGPLKNEEQKLKWESEPFHRNNAMISPSWHSSVPLGFLHKDVFSLSTVSSHPSLDPSGPPTFSMASPAPPAAAAIFHAIPGTEHFSLSV